MEWQVLFDGGHQQRYLPDRQAVLGYVLEVIDLARPGEIDRLRRELDGPP